MLASMAQVEPLPFVPATSAMRSWRSGAPARSSSARVRPSFHWLSALARGFQPTPRSWSARLNSQATGSCTCATLAEAYRVLALDSRRMLQHLREVIRDYGSAITAFSAGVDSTLVAVVAQQDR